MVAGETSGSNSFDIESHMEQQDHRLDSLEVETAGLRSELVQNRVLLGALQAQLLRLQTALAKVPGLQLQLEPLLGMQDHDSTYKPDAKDSAKLKAFQRVNGKSKRSDTRLGHTGVSLEPSQTQRGGGVDHSASPLPVGTVAAGSAPETSPRADDSICGSARVRSSSVASAESSGQASSLPFTPQQTLGLSPSRKEHRLGSFVIVQTPPMLRTQSGMSETTPKESLIKANAANSSQQSEESRPAAVAEELPLGPCLPAASKEGDERRLSSPVPLNASLDAMEPKVVSRGASPLPPAALLSQDACSEIAASLTASAWPTRFLSAPQRQAQAAAAAAAVAAAVPAGVATTPAGESRMLVRRLVSEGPGPGSRQAMASSGQPPPPLMNSRSPPPVLASGCTSPMPASLTVCPFQGVGSCTVPRRASSERRSDPSLDGSRAIHRGESPRAEGLMRTAPSRATVGEIPDRSRLSATTPLLLKDGSIKRALSPNMLSPESQHGSASLNMSACSTKHIQVTQLSPASPPSTMRMSVAQGGMSKVAAHPCGTSLAPAPLARRSSGTGPCINGGIPQSCVTRGRGLSAQRQEAPAVAVQRARSTSPVVPGRGTV